MGKGKNLDGSIALIAGSSYNLLDIAKPFFYGRLKERLFFVIITVAPWAGALGFVSRQKAEKRQATEIAERW